MAKDDRTQKKKFIDAAKQLGEQTRESDFNHSLKSIAPKRKTTTPENKD